MVSADNTSVKEEVYADSNVVNNFTLDDARQLTEASDKILCTLDDNKYIRFGEYSVLDYDSKTKLLHVDEQTNVMMDNYARQKEAEGTLTMNDRILKHSFSPAFFQLKTLELNLQFTNVFEDKPLKDLVLVEKHFFRD